MSLTKAQIRTIVQVNIGNRTDINTTIDNGIAAGVLELCERFNFQGLVVSTTLSVVAGDYTKAMASTTFRISKLIARDGLNSWNLIQRTKGWVLQRWPLPSAEAQTRPVYYYVENGTLYFNAPFNASFTLDITSMNLEAFTGDSDTLANLPQVDNALVSYTTFYTFRAIQQFDEATYWERQWEKDLKIVIDADKKNLAMEVQADLGSVGYGNEGPRENVLSPFTMSDGSEPS